MSKDWLIGWIAGAVMVVAVATGLTIGGVSSLQQQTAQKLECVEHGGSAVEVVPPGDDWSAEIECIMPGTKQ